jgi:hypothetical protein
MRRPRFPNQSSSLIKSPDRINALPVAFIFALRAKASTSRLQGFRGRSWHHSGLAFPDRLQGAGDFALQNAGWGSLTWAAGVWPQVRFATGLFIFLSGIKALLLRDKTDVFCGGVRPWRPRRRIGF